MKDGKGPGRSRVVRNKTSAKAFSDLCDMHAQLKKEALVAEWNGAAPPT